MYYFRKNQFKYEDFVIFMYFFMMFMFMFIFFWIKKEKKKNNIIKFYK